MKTHSTLTRSQKLLDKIAPANQIGLEIGPLCRPCITKAAGEIYYVDFISTALLRENYKNTPSVNIDDIVEVDFVWDQRSLYEAVGRRRFDYIIASHVIEHAPDLVGWLGQLSDVLNDNGIISLIIPDKRFTFDRLRTVTTLAEVVDAHINGDLRPSVRQTFDHIANHVALDPLAAWRGDVEDDKLLRLHPLQQAMNMARTIHESGQYYDAHCSVFTPDSFLNLFLQLAELGLTDLSIASFHDTEFGEIDFFVSLVKTAPVLGADRKFSQQREAVTTALSQIRGR